MTKLYQHLKKPFGYFYQCPKDQFKIWNKFQLEIITIIVLKLQQITFIHRFLKVKTINICFYGFNFYLKLALF